MPERKALGRGLSTLLGTPDLEPDKLREIAIERIVPNANQPRKSFDDSALDDLAASIGRHGIVQPLVVRPMDDGVFEIIAGERRWRAAQRAGLFAVPAIVREAEEHQALELALVENVQREDLNPADEARAYQRLMSEFGLTQDQVAERVGKGRASVANMLRLLRLPPEVLAWLESGQLSTGHAKALLSLEDAGRIVEAAREMIGDRLTVRQAEALVAGTKPSTAGAPPRGSEGLGSSDPNLRAAVDSLERALGTKVTIRQRGTRGRIEIYYHSREERDRLYAGLVGTRF